MHLRGACVQALHDCKHNHGRTFLPMQNPTEDVIDSKLRALNLHDAPHITFAHFCHVW